MNDPTLEGAANNEGVNAQPSPEDAEALKNALRNLFSQLAGAPDGGDEETEEDEKYTREEQEQIKAKLSQCTPSMLLKVAKQTTIEFLMRLTLGRRIPFLVDVAAAEHYCRVWSNIAIVTEYCLTNEKLKENLSDTPQGFKELVGSYFPETSIDEIFDAAASGLFDDFIAEAELSRQGTVSNETHGTITIELPGPSSEG